MMYTKSDHDKGSSENEFCMKNLNLGDNYIPYSCCVHVFRPGIKGYIMVQSNNECITKKLRDALKERFPVRCSIFRPPYLIAVKTELYAELIKKVESTVNNIINQPSSNGKAVSHILKFYEKSDDPYFADVNHLPTIILW